MKAILTDNATKSVFATLDIDNTSLNATNGGPQLFQQISLHLIGTACAAIPPATGDYSLEIEDDAGVLLETHPSVTFQSYSRVANETGMPPGITVSSNTMAFKIN